MDKQWKVGDQVWMEPFGTPLESRYAPIVKVGRKWLTLDADFPTPLVVSKENLIPQNYVGWYRVWKTKEDCEQNERNRVAWLRFVAVVASTYARPDNVTADRIEQAAKLLGIELGAK